MCAMGGGRTTGTLLRPATYLEELSEMGHLNDTLLSGYMVRVKAGQPITHAQVFKALQHLRRQVPCLRLCYGESGGSTWMQESTEEKIDMEMLDGDIQLEDVLAIVSRYRYRSRLGPLWCVKVIGGYTPPRVAPAAAAENVSRPDTGLGTSSPEEETKEGLEARPDTGFGAHPSERFDCPPLMPGQMIGVPINQSNSCIIIQPQAPAPGNGPVPAQQYDEHLICAVEGEVQGAEGDDYPSYVLEYEEGASGYNRPSPEQAEEAFTSSSEGPWREEDPTCPSALCQGAVQQYPLHRPASEGALHGNYRPRSRSSSNPVLTYGHGPGSLPGTAHSAATAIGPGREESGYAMSVFSSEEEAAATAAATAVAPRELGSSRSSFVGTPSSASPLFLDTASSSLSSSPHVGPSPPPAQVQGVIGANLNWPTSVVFGFHLGIADGITAMNICGHFVRLLNYVLGEVEIDDSFTLDENSVDELRDALNSRSIVLHDMAKHEEMRAQIEERSGWESCTVGVFKESEPGPGGAGGRAGRRPRHRNRHDALNLDADSTSRLLERCELEGVRLMAAMSAIFNIALIDVLTARDINKQFYKFYSGHGINLRPFTGCTDNVQLTGCLTAPAYLSIPTPHHAADNFWGFARSIETEFKHLEECEQALMEVAFMELNPLRQSDYNELFREPLPPMKDYYAAFLGDVTELVTEGGPHAVVDHVETSMSRHKLGYAVTHILHIFQDSLCISVNYSSRYLTVDVAKEYVSNIYRRLHEMLV